MSRFGGNVRTTGIGDGIRRPGSPGFGGNGERGFPSNSPPKTPGHSGEGGGGWGWNNGSGGWGNGIWKPDAIPGVNMPLPNSGFTPIPNPPPRNPPTRLPSPNNPINPVRPRFPDIVNNSIREALEQTFNPKPDPAIQDLIDENNRIVEEFTNPESQQRAKEREQHQNRFRELMDRPGNEFGISSVGRWVIFRGAKEWRAIERWGNTNQPDSDQTQFFDSPVKKYYVPPQWELVTKSTGDIREDWYQGLGFTNWGTFTFLYMKSPEGDEFLLDPPGEFQYLVNHGGIVSTQWWGYSGSEFSESNNSATVNTFKIEFDPPYPVPIATPFPLLVYPVTEEEDMPCERCRAEEIIWMLRSMKQNIPVNETTIVPLPTGNLVTIDSTSIKTVFCLPGTQNSIRDQFNLLAEIKKRLAKTFNQSRMAKVLARLQQVLSATDFVLNLHNALMLSEDIATTFFGTITGAVDIVIKVADDAPFIGGLFDTGETPINTGQIIGEKIESACKSIFGVQNWAQMKQKWAAFNNIVRGAAMQIQAARDIGDAQKDLSEMTASRLGKLHNKLAKAGVLFDNDLWEEKVNRRWAWMYKLEDMAEDNAVTNAAQFISSWGGQVLDIKEQKKEMQESREKFQKDLQKDLGTLYEAKDKTNLDSTGKTYTRSDANPPETDDPQS